MGTTRISRAAALLAAIAYAAGASLDARAQAPAEAVAPPRFTISQFEVIGNTLLPADEIEYRVAPFTGPDRDFGDVQRALEALEEAYRDLGYGVVRVLLPEQDITQGIVRFRVVQPRVGKVTIEGNAHFDDGNVRRSLPAVQEGEPPNSKAIARDLQLAGEHPVKQTYVLLRAGASEDEVDVSIRVTDDKPWRVFVTLDNTGTNETGVARLGIGAQHSNVFNRDHTVTAQYVTSPSEPDQVSIYGVGYRVPFYGLHSSLDLVAGYSDVDSGTVQGLFNVSGSGSIALVRWNTILPKWESLEQKVSFGLDYRAFQNDVQFQGSASIVPDITIRPASLNYGALWRGAGAELNFYGNYSRNIPGARTAPRRSGGRAAGAARTSSTTTRSCAMASATSTSFAASGRHGSASTASTRATRWSRASSTESAARTPCAATCCASWRRTRAIPLRSSSIRPCSSPPSGFPTACSCGASASTTMAR